MKIDNIISHVDVHQKKATVFPGTPLADRMRQPFTLEYDADIDLRELDLSIVITPFLLNVIPLLWFLGGTYKVDSMDEDMFASLEQIKEGFRTLYPNVPWEGRLIPETLTSTSRRKNNTDLSQVLFFSGGVDSTYSALHADPDRTILLTIRGHDIALNNDQAWETVCSQVDNFASSFDFKTERVSANVFRLLRCGDIHKEHPELKPWYGTVQHGLGLSGLAFPLAVYNGWDNVIFSSSIANKVAYIQWGAHPYLEPRLKVSGIRVVAEGIDFFCADKVQSIVDYCRSKLGQDKPFMRVCLDNMSGNAEKNCGLCEKCLRSIVSLIIKSEDPSDWGFPVPLPLFEVLKERLEDMYIRLGCINQWDHIHHLVSEALPESRGEHREFLNWYIDWYSREYLS